MCSKSTGGLVICSQARYFVWHLLTYLKFLVRSGFYVDDKEEDRPDVLMFENWQSWSAFVQEGFSAFKGERREADERSTNRDKRFSKTSNLLVRTQMKQSKSKQITLR